MANSLPNAFICTLTETLEEGGSEVIANVSSLMTLDNQPLDISLFDQLDGEIHLTCGVESSLQLEYMKATGINLIGLQFTGLTRGWSFVGDTQIPANVKFHPVGATVIITWGTHDLLKFIDSSTDQLINGLKTFLLAKRPRLTADADALFANQLITLGQLQRTAIAGGVNATTLIQGFVQLATQAQYDAKTTIGSTGASLVAPPNLNRATKYNDGVDDIGAVNAYVINPSPAITAYVAYQQFTFKATNSNTGSSTLNVNGLGLILIKNSIGLDLVKNDIIAGTICIVEYDGTNFRLISVSGNASNGNLFTVNADETIANWFTSYLKAPATYSMNAGSFNWSINGGTLSPVVTELGNFSYISNMVTQARTSVIGFGGTVTNMILLFGTTKKIRMKMPVGVIASAFAGHGMSIGFGETYLPIDNTTFNINAIRIFQDPFAGTCQAIVSNQAAIFTATMAGVSSNVFNLFEIIYDPVGLTAEFYSNGILKATITNSDIAFPSIASNLFISVSGDTGGIHNMAFGDITVSQEV